MGFVLDNKLPITASALDGIVGYHFQPIGSPTQPIEGCYMANSWLRMKHTDYDQLRRMLDQVGRTLKVIAGWAEPPRFASDHGHSRPVSLGRWTSKHSCLEAQHDRQEAKGLH